MSKAVLRAMALMAFAVPGFAAAQSFVDTNPYVVQPSLYPYASYAPGYMMDNHYPWQTTVVPFNSSQSYSMSEQYSVLQNETTITGGTLVYNPSTYDHELIIEQATIPEAFQQSVPPPTEFRPTAEWTNPNETFNKVYGRSERFGNSIFGAGYDISASVTATTGTATQAKKVEAFAEGKVFGTAFSYEKELIRGRVFVTGQQGGANSGTATLYAMGQQIWSTNLYATYSPPPIDWSRTFFNASKTFMVGPVPITVRASLAGGVKLTVTGQVGPTVAKLSATPGGWANVTASASVDIVVFAFGVEGSLSLINATLPSTGELFWPVCTLDWTLKSDLNLNTLSGTLKLFAKLRLLFFTKTWRVTIASWPGITRNWSLLNLNGSQPLGICS